MLLEDHLNPASAPVAPCARTAELPSGVFVIRRADDRETHVWTVPGSDVQSLVIAEYVPARGEYVNEVRVALDRRSCAEFAGYVLRSSC
jgi:hypothetical protein